MWIEAGNGRLINSDAIADLKRDGRRLVYRGVHEPLWCEIKAYETEEEAREALRIIARTLLGKR